MSDIMCQLTERAINRFKKALTGRLSILVFEDVVCVDCLIKVAVLDVLQNLE